MIMNKVEALVYVTTWIGWENSKNLYLINTMQHSLFILPCLFTRKKRCNFSPPKTNFCSMNSDMVGVRTFLESSTIHGLSYISTTRKYARIFWILVVLAGFIGAAFLIHESFYSWSESPVTTTVETFPISDVRFPKVTVCPPKNTYTDINYDLLISENITLTDKMRDEMFKYALEIIEETPFSTNLWTKIHESDRSYNWYQGFTQIKPPVLPPWSQTIEYEIYSSATSGVITSQYFGEDFQADLVEKQTDYWISVNPPTSCIYNENVTLHFKTEKVSMSSEHDYVNIDGINLDSNISVAFKNFTPPGTTWKVNTMSRDVSSSVVEKTKLALMPGFQFSWWYTGDEVTPERQYKDDTITKLFVR